MTHPLRIYRKRHGLTLDAMAGHLDISASMLSRIETGLVPPSAETLKRVHEATSGEITPNAMLGIEVHPSEGAAA